MREDAGIAADADVDAGGNGSTHVLSLGAYARGFLRDVARVPAAVCGDGVTGGHRRTEADVALFHQLKDFGSAAIAVLDGCDAGEGRAPHSFGGCSMRDHAASRTGRDVDDVLQLR